jgi:hypothetical protein
MLKPSLIPRLLPGLKPVQRMLLSQKKKLLPKNGDNSSKPNCFKEAARSKWCEPLFCNLDRGVDPEFRFPQLAQCQAHRFSLALKVDLQDCRMVFGETPQDSR